MIKTCSELSTLVYDYATGSGLEYKFHIKGSHLYLAFAGSEDLEDWIINLNISTTDGVHSGMLHALEEKLKEIVNLLRYQLSMSGIRTVITCGHSAGGAFALLMAMRLEKLSKGLDIRCVTFGQPAIFSKRADLSGYSFYYYRVANRLDPIVYLPFNLNHRPVGKYREILFWDFRFFHSKEWYTRRFS